MFREIIGLVQRERDKASSLHSLSSTGELDQREVTPDYEIGAGQLV